MKPNISLACKKSPFFSTGKNGSKTIAPEEHFPRILALTLKLTQTLTPAGGGGGSNFLWGIVRTPVKTKETKNRKEIENNRIKKKTKQNKSG